SVYGTNAGLIVSEVGGGGNPRVWRTKDGLLWFSSERGLVRIDPATLRKNSVPPDVVIERVTVDNNPVRADTLVVVNPGNTKVEFEYTGISFSAPERVRFQHRLVGFEEEWEDVGVKRFVQYTNLPPGEYTFRVRAANTDGVWNEEGASLAMVVVPAFWQTAWFLTLAVLVFSLAGPSVYVLRVRMLKQENAKKQQFSRQLIERQENERNRIAREMHDSLGQELLVLKHRIQLSLRNPGDLEMPKETLQGYSDSVSGILDKTRQISHDLRPPELDQLGLSETLRSILARVRAANRFELVGEIDEIDGVFARGEDIHVVRILQEALSNAIKHSQAT
ncbi:MAG: triple tyrosine motif-containing protein, partial [Bacteroidota bacterium]